MCSLFKYCVLLSLVFFVIQINAVDVDDPEISYDTTFDKEVNSNEDNTEIEAPSGPIDETTEVNSNEDNTEIEAPSGPIDETTFDKEVNDDEIEEQNDEEESLGEDTIEDDDSATNQRSCACKAVVNLALVNALQSCTEVLDAVQTCRSPSRSRKPFIRFSPILCKCHDKVNAALVKSLKSCNDAITTSTGCTGGSNPPTIRPPTIRPPTVRPPTGTKASSCSQLLRLKPNTPSGMYTLTVNGRSTKVYCFMGAIKGLKGWTLVSYLGRSSKVCPRPLVRIVTNGVRHCARSPRTTGTCASLKIPSLGIRYTRVAGKVYGVQFGHTDGARAYSAGKKSINNAYIDGVSITQGYPRRHVWSFISALTSAGRADCPCAKGSDKGSYPPSFVGSSYFCETGFRKGYPARYAVEDPLWDGRKCYGNEASCCRRSGVFQRYLGRASTKPLELRVCCDEGTAGENVSILQYSIYVR